MHVVNCADVVVLRSAKTGLIGTRNIGFYLFGFGHGARFSKGSVPKSLAILRIQNRGVSPKLKSTSHRRSRYQRKHEIE